jgi:UDP-N-acetylglucosamine/UDP-N-acetylgalactosamine diphosphorylase
MFNFSIQATKFGELKGQVMRVVERLLHRGVRIPNPGSVEIGSEVDIERIAVEGVTIHAGCRISGKNTLILPGARLGQEGPVSIENCLVGPFVELRGGFFREAVFLARASCGLGAHVREGTILEEGASIAHTVGLKQTILFPFVTLGSLINFCDCLMSGGTGKKDHSEVGSSYIHFNFTPSQDKATASLLGDVPRGVMLDQPPIFLGGQGGLVGPCRLAFGTTIAAGTICRKDELRPGHLIFGGSPGKGGSIPFTPGANRGVGRILRNNLEFIAQLAALGQWYRHARAAVSSPALPAALLDALQCNLQEALAERIARLGEFIARLEEAEPAGQGTGRPAAGWMKGGWSCAREAILEECGKDGEAALRTPFLETLQRAGREAGGDYLAAIGALSASARERGTAWLDAVAGRVAAAARALLLPDPAGPTQAG